MDNIMRKPIDFYWNRYQ